MFLSVETTITNFALGAWFLEMEPMSYGLYDIVMHCECPYYTFDVRTNKVLYGRVNDPVAYKNSNIYDVKSLQKTN
jgi:hypothetical protein